MHNILRTGIALFLIVSMQLQGNAQQVMKDNIVEKFEAYRSGVYLEKIYLHTDKPAYIAGEICWFTINCVDAFNHQASDLSKIAYVEILDSLNRPVSQIKVALDNGSGDGSMQIPVNMASGFYKIRAYTHWMQNFDAAYFFETTLKIINATTDGVVTASSITGAIKGTCVVEGGSLVMGLPGKVVFKLADESGKGIEASGHIALEGGDVITKIKTEPNGFASFAFTPTMPGNYHAVFTLPNGALLQVNFPTITPQGYSILLDASGKQNIGLKVFTNLANQLNGTIKLFAHTRHADAFSVQAQMNNGVASFTIDEEKLKAGITHFTVFNTQNQPLLQRLYFKHPPVLPSVLISADQATYGLRSPISIEVNTASVGSNVGMVQGSLSVYRVDSIQGTNPNTMESYWYLAADLTDRVYNPAMYFASQNGYTPSALDNLMITQTWKRFDWNELLAGRKPAFQYLPEYVGHLIEGKILANQGKPTDNSNAYIASVGKKTQFHIAKSSEDSKLLFEIKDFYNSGELVVQTNPLQDSNYTVEIADPFAKKYSAWKLPAIQATTVGETDLLQLHRSTQVQQAYVAGKLATYLQSEDSTAFFLNPEATYLLDNFVRFTSMEDILREYVTEVMVTRRRGSFQLSVYDQVSKVLLSNNPLVLLDGVPMFDIDKVMALDPIQLSKMEIVAKKYFFKEQMFFGVILLSTYNGKLPADYVFDEKATVIKYDGLQKARVFYSPDYAEAAAKESRLPDYRNVLLWKSNITLDAGDTQRFNFYSGDMPGKYIAVWNGTYPNGQTASKHVFFEVQ